jgi:hypothetical protein
LARRRVEADFAIKGRQLVEMEVKEQASNKRDGFYLKAVSIGEVSLIGERGLLSLDVAHRLRVIKK